MEARTLHRSIIDDLLAGPSTEPQSIKEPEPAEHEPFIFSYSMLYCYNNTCRYNFPNSYTEFFVSSK